MDMARYAIYLAPPVGHALSTLAERWLGRGDVADSSSGLPPWLAPDEWWRMTTAARHYGFHATLKAPIRLRPGMSATMLGVRFDAFAADAPPLPPQALVLGVINGFIALLPAAPAPALDDLAARVVIGFEPFRAPPPAEELAKRRANGLSPRQEAHLRDWGYPYVFDEFRFHMTLTARLSDPRPFLEFLTSRFAPALAEPVPLELALCAQTAPTERFEILRRAPR